MIEDIEDLLSLFSTEQLQEELRRRGFNEAVDPLEFTDKDFEEMRCENTTDQN